MNSNLQLSLRKSKLFKVVLSSSHSHLLKPHFSKFTSLSFFNPSKASNPSTLTLFSNHILLNSLLFISSIPPTLLFQLVMMTYFSKLLDPKSNNLKKHVARIRSNVGEEVLSKVNQARKSLNEGEEVALQCPEAIEAFRMLSPNMVIMDLRWRPKMTEGRGRRLRIF